MAVFKHNSRVLHFVISDFTWLLFYTQHFLGKNFDEILTSCSYILLNFSYSNYRSEYTHGPYFYVVMLKQGIALWGGVHYLLGFFVNACSFEMHLILYCLWTLWPLSQGHNIPCLQNYGFKGYINEVQFQPINYHQGIRHKAMYFQSIRLTSLFYISQVEDLFQQVKVAYLACIGRKDLSLVVISCCYHTAVLALSRTKQNLSLTLRFINPIFFVLAGFFLSFQQNNSMIQNN